MIKAIFDKFNHKDNGYLVRRYISLSGHIIAMVIMVKLTWMSQLTEGYFGIYVAFVAGHASAEKYIARKKVE